jgi:hypothetical protein
MAERTSRKKRNIKAKNQRMILAIGITSIMKEQKIIIIEHPIRVVNMTPIYNSTCFLVDVFLMMKMCPFTGTPTSCRKPRIDS